MLQRARSGIRDQDSDLGGWAHRSDICWDGDGYVSDKLLTATDRHRFAQDERDPFVLEEMGPRQSQIDDLDFDELTFSFFRPEEDP